MLALLLESGLPPLLLPLMPLKGLVGENAAAAPGAPASSAGATAGAGLCDSGSTAARAEAAGFTRRGEEAGALPTSGESGQGELWELRGSLLAADLILIGGRAGGGLPLLVVCCNVSLKAWAGSDGSWGWRGGPSSRRPATRRQASVEATEMYTAQRGGRHVQEVCPGQSQH